MDRRYKVYTQNIQAPNFLMTALELKDYWGQAIPAVIQQGRVTIYRQDEDELFIQLQAVAQSV
jgi:ribosome biogenesis protein Nip4